MNMQINRCRHILFCGLLVLSCVSWAGIDPATGQPLPDRTLKPTFSQTIERAEPTQEMPERTYAKPVRAEVKTDLKHETPALPKLLSSGFQAPGTKAQKQLIIFNEWLVSSASLETATREQKQLEVFGLKIKSRQWLPQLGFVVSVYRLPVDADPIKLLEQVLQKYPQLHIEYNQRFPLLGIEKAKQYGYTLTGTSVQGCPAFRGTVAMMDGKVNQALPVFKNHTLEVQDVLAVKGAAPSNHGTAVAYLYTRLLPGASLLAINIYKEGDEGMETRSDWLLGGFEAVLAHSPLPQVLNMSFGGNESRLLQQAITRLDEKGIRLVAAAGNGGRQAQPVFPAAYQKVRAVGALDINEQVWAGSNRGEYITFTAPGVDLWLLDARGQGAFLSGTSYAAPWASAAAALASEEQWEKPSMLARDLGKPGRDSLYGYGLVQLGSLCH